MSKHNKKRNTAFIYEALVREVVKQSVAKSTNKRNIAIGLLKEHFKKNTMLRKELDLYKALLETKDIDEKIAEKLISETKRQHQDIDQNQLFTEQSEVISVINKRLSKGVFTNFVPSYKDLATIAQIFSDTTKPKNKVLLENKILEKMTLKKDYATSPQAVSNLVVKSFVSRFNEVYGHLLEEQKEMLSKYITSFVDDGTEFNFYLNEEIGRLKNVLKDSKKLKEVKEDSAMNEKLLEVVKILNAFKEKPSGKDDLLNLLGIQNLVRELQS